MGLGHLCPHPEPAHRMTPMALKTVWRKVRRLRQRGRKGVWRLALLPGASGPSWCRAWSCSHLRRWRRLPQIRQRLCRVRESRGVSRQRERDRPVLRLHAAHPTALQNPGQEAKSQQGGSQPRGAETEPTLMERKTAVHVFPQ